MSSTSNCEDQTNQDAASDLSDESKRINLDLWEESLSPENDDVLPEVLKFSELYEEDNSRDSHVVNEVFMSDVPSDELSILASNADKDSLPKTKENEQDVENVEVDKCENGEAFTSDYERDVENIEVEKREKSEGFASKYKTDVENVEVDKHEKSEAFASENNPFKSNTDSKKLFTPGNNWAVPGEYNPFNTTADRSLKERNQLNCDTVRKKFAVSSRSQLIDYGEIKLRFDPTEINPFANKNSQCSEDTSRNNSVVRERSQLIDYGEIKLRFIPSEINPFQCIMDQLHYGSQGRSPLTSGKRQLHGETKERRPFITEKNQLRPEFHEDNRLGSKKSRFSSETERSSFGESQRRGPFSTEKNQYSPKFDEDKRLGSNGSRFLSETGKSTFSSDKIEFRQELNVFKSVMNRPEMRCDEEDTDRTTLIVPEGYPRKKFTRLEVTVLKALLQNHVAHITQEGAVGLTLVRTKIQNGTCLVLCKDRYTKQWLDNLVPQLKRYNGEPMRTWTVEGNLKESRTTINKGNLVRAKIWFPRSCMMPAAVVLLQIAALNPGIETNHWNILNKTPKYIRLAITQKDVVCLKKYNMQVRAAEGLLKIELYQ
ncbi:uncharacterized protein LOC114342175 [Diabrotica virgifera virgifera]|uniref:DUF4780 domain-containing protein n=1 Tax=Diabrotica virgifera virgifera TaxID=50390 RepID=A0ABM5IY69_DIAVI|nr:uncharacterized protein LOC114342175 [Diabrotica virgifera virgifera]